MDRSAFDSLITPARAGAGRFAIDVPDGWQQGRGAYGGFVLAAIVRAIEAEVDDRDRALRSLSASLCGPLLPGGATIEVDVLRKGSAVTTAAATLRQDGVVAHAIAVLGHARDVDPPPLSISPPEPPGWRDVAALTVPGAPAFTRFFEFRPLLPFPFARTQAADAHGFIRLRDPGPTRDAAWVVACADAWWPGLLATLPAPRPVATIAFTLELLCDPASLDPDPPLYHRGRGLVTHEGYHVEARELWDENGRLVALNQQTFAVIR